MRYKFLKPAMTGFYATDYRFAWEEIQCASFIERNFDNDAEAIEYAQWMFGNQAIAERENET